MAKSLLKKHCNEAGRHPSLRVTVLTLCCAVGSVLGAERHNLLTFGLFGIPTGKYQLAYERRLADRHTLRVSLQFHLSWSTTTWGAGGELTYQFHFKEAFKGFYLGGGAALEYREIETTVQFSTYEEVHVVPTLDVAPIVGLGGRWLIANRLFLGLGVTCGYPFRAYEGEYAAGDNLYLNLMGDIGVVF